MSNDSSQVMLRSVIGFIVSPLIPSILYTWFSWGEAFFPAIFFAAFVAYIIALVLVLPVYMIIFRKRIFNLYSASGLSFLILFSFFSLLFVSMGSGYNALTSGSEALVENGQLTAAGYSRAFYGAFLIGLYGMLGGLIFSAFIRGKSVFNFSFV